MDVPRFHRELLGIHKGRTPEEFRLNPTHEALYTAFTRDGLHGYSNSRLDETLFTATFVLGLCITKVIRPVYVAVPKQHVRWVVDQIERIGRHIFRSRRGDKNGVLVMRQAFKQIRVTDKILRMMEEPQHWVMFGFTNKDVVPEWAKGKLLEQGELRAPLIGAIGLEP